MGRTLVSGAEDKTVKLWRLADGTLERTLRLPQGGGNLGKVYAVAISPDGSEVAAGGWTGSADGSNNTIYIFDRTTGAVKHRIGGLPCVINHLAYDAPDGDRLVATLAGANGIRLYETNDYIEISRDSDYDNNSLWADFSVDGRLVVSSDDGRLRLYGPAGDRVKIVEAPGGQYPYGVAFSPDGSRIAVGYDDSTRVEVLDAYNLERLYVVDSLDPDNGNLGRVAWSVDGKTLLAGGTYAEGDWTPVRRWSDAGHGSYDEYYVTTNTVMGLCSLADGRLAVGAGNGLLVIDPPGDVLWSQPNAMVDFRALLHDDGIRLSPTADAVAFGFEYWGKRPALFSLREATLTPEPQDLEHLSLPDEGPRDGVVVTDWEDTYQPKINDQPIVLGEFEQSRALAIAPDGDCLVLGADYGLRAFALKKSWFRDKPIELWRQDAPGVVWAVNISGDGRYVVAGYGDGTLRWHRLEDGEEVLAFYPHPDGRRWVLWTPGGYYQASAGGEDLIGWHVNRHGDLKTPDFFGVSRFRDRFYRPDVIARVLETGDPDEALRLADAERGTETQTRSVAESLPPTITILSPVPGTTMDSQRLVLLYKTTSQDSPVTKIEARSDGRPAEVLEDHQPSVSDEGLEIVGQITLVIPPQDGVVELIAHNAHGASEPATFMVNWGGAADFYKPSLYVLAVGVSAYPSDKLKLKYAAHDAEAFADVLATQQGGLYKEVQTRLLADEKATRDDIREGLNWLRRNVGQRDVAVVFLSGHGINEDGSYYFICVDADPLDPMFSALGDDDIRKFLGKVTGKTVLLLDTCYSGSLQPGKGGMDSLPDIDKFANELADAESGVVVYSSSTGKEKSLEDEQWGHGAFTYALLEAVRDGKADFTDNGHVTVDELGVYLDDCVKRLTNGRQHPTVTKPQAVRNYAMFRVQKAE